MANYVIGIGELLWDLFPSGKRLGGAPLNFCYHCRQLGAEAYPISAIGADEFGAEIRDMLASKEIAGDFVVEDVVHPTGTVQVALDGDGKPSYEITRQVAWDYIPMSGHLETVAQKTDAVCFGSLAQRNSVSHITIQAFLRAMAKDALQLFDINLRQAFFTKEIIEESLLLCNVLKLSDEELPVLSEWFGIQGSVDHQLQTLRSRFDLDVVAYTRGPAGSLLIARDAVSDHPGFACNAVNTVGAGDSFSATLCMGLLRRRPLDEINKHANRIASFVCQQDSATPELAENLKGTIDEN